ncbi:hypothetical protein ACFL6G_09960, partial [candidate division KSB1 bacterium]
QDQSDNIIRDYKILMDGWVTEFEVSKSNPGIIYAMQRSENGYFTYKSSDGGETWKKLNTLNYGKEIAIDPVDPDIVFAVPGG